jgi:YVTN family beta-propeller protein
MTRTSPRPASLLLVTLLTALLQAAGAALVGAATLVVANKSEATVSLIDLGSGKVAATLPVGQGPHEVAVSPDGRLALVANYGQDVDGHSLTVIDVPGARVERTIDLEEYRRPHGLAFLDDRRALVTVEENQAVLEVDVAAGRLGRAIPTNQQVSHMVAVSPDGRRAYVANIGSGTISALDLTAGKRIKNVATGAGAEGIAVTPDGKEIWVTNREADTVTVVDAATLEPVVSLPAPGYPIRVKVTPDGRRALVTEARAGELAVFDVAARKLERRLPFGLKSVAAPGDKRLLGSLGQSSAPIGLVVEPGGKRAYVAHANADLVAVVDLEAWKPAGTLKAGKEPDGIGWSARDVKAAGKKSL